MRAQNLKQSMKLRIAIVVLLGVLLALPYAFDFAGQLRERARKSEPRAMLGSLHSAMQSYHSEWKTYSDKTDEIGFTPLNNLRAQYFFRTDQVPEELRRSLTNDEMPYVEKDRFKLLATFALDEGEIALWTINEKAELVELPKRLSKASP